MPLCRAVHPNAKVLITLLRVLGNMADEAELIINTDEVVIRALDPARVSLAEITIPSSTFIEYDVPSEMSIGLNLNSLVKSVPKPKKGDKLTFTAMEDFYELVLEGGTRRRYKFRSIEVSPIGISELNLDFKVRAVVLSSAFRDAIKDLEGSEGVEFIAESTEFLLLKARGLNAQAKLSKAAGSLIELEVKEPSKSVYDTDYLTKTVDLLNMPDMLELSYGTDLPVSISFRLVDDTIIKYLLAPKV